MHDVCQLCFVGTTADTVYDCVYLHVYLSMDVATHSSFTASVVMVFITSNTHVGGALGWGWGLRI